ncbi:MAG: ribosome biogenesis GTPase Der [Acidimicrobiia bacterium]|jgi:GTP-binding protein|nr:ribosome biogenesis GTPase Der [Acidimicrobiia bacterium]MBP8179825.1 ribosome biogenesis GTPase Der [Acidimicrobiia bacterium]
MVVVVGRPNVGKSTLVNRIVGKRAAIVEEEPGVTRDRKILSAEWIGRTFDIMDTGGWIDDDQPLIRQVSDQAERGMAQGDLILMVVDGTVGVTDEDRAVAKLVQRSNLPALLVVNKIDNETRELDIWEFAALGLSDPVGVSAIHGRLTGDLMDMIVERLPEEEEEEVVEDEGDEAFSVAIVGRPNVGKSTLFNRLVGDERSVTHDMPGTTRDAIDTVVETEHGKIRFVDTAGMRRKSRIDEGVEYFGLVRALQAIDRADAALFVIDATEGVTHQDQRLAERVDAAGCAMVIIANKWDLLTTEQKLDVRKQIERELSFCSYAPLLSISALTGAQVGRILPTLRDARHEYERRIPTGALNEVLNKAQAHHPPPIDRGHRPRILYATQGATDPPTITLFTSRRLPKQYLRYLERSIREAFDIGATPIKLRVRVR